MRPVSEGQQVASPTSQCTYVFKHLYVAWRYGCLQTCGNVDRFVSWERLAQEGRRQYRQIARLTMRQSGSAGWWQPPH